MIPTTHSNRFARRPCSFPSHPALSLSSKNSLFSRIILDSSLFFATGDFCPGVSQRHGSLSGENYFVEFQQCIERRLDKRSIISGKGREKLEYSQRDWQAGYKSLVAAITVVPRQQNSTDNPVPTHLIMRNSLSKSFDESRHLSGILALIYEPSRGTFCQQCLRSPLNLFQCTAKTIRKGKRARNWRAYLVNSTRRPVSSGSPSIVVVMMFCLSLSNWGLRAPTFSFTSSNCCERSVQLCTALIYLANTS